jgi:hypothetical protein
MREAILELLGRRSYTDDELRALGAAAIPALIAMYAEASGDEGEHRRRQIIRMLGVLDGPEAVAFLAKAFREAAGTNETLAVAAADALARTDHESALAVVLPLLDSGDERIRRIVVNALGGSLRPQVLERVRALARTDPDDAVREQAELSARSIEQHLA